MRAMSDPTDLELLQACVDGDRRAWARFVERFSRYVYYLVQLTARRYEAAMDEAEVADLHNDVFLALMEDDCRRLRSFEGKNGCSVRSWIRLIAIRRTVDALRRRRHHLHLDAEPALELADDAPDPYERLLASGAREKRERLMELAEALSESDRLLLHLLYTEKLSPDAAAAALRIKKGALYTRKSRLVSRLRAEAERAGLLE
jgi:RNA polymerase sigma factor (sigma-70 family)